MKLSIYPSAGDARMATRLEFIAGDGVLATVSCPRLGGFLVAERASEPGPPTDDVDEAAGVLALLLHRYRDASLLIPSEGGYSLRGDEDSTADVYPAEHHPRIKVHR